MCGIAGFAGSGSGDALRKMAHAIRRRGPDDEGFYEEPGVGFAFRRLSIIDVVGGHQPLCNEDGTIWVMLNGEIYGYAALRDVLVTRGHRFVTKSDTETIVHAYEEWGDGCFEKLHGMFAIAIWDGPNQRLVLARDRLGKKPLYWTVHHETVWFCSELKGLLAANVVSQQIDPLSLALYFRTDAVPTPRAIFQGVNKLEPGTAMSWTRGAVEKTWRFWSCPPGEMSVDAPSAVAGLGERVDRAVRDRLVSDVPLGLFLSGGLDSAVVAESAARQSPGALKAFTVGFEERSHDEREAARLVAQSLGLEHYEDVLTGEKALALLDDAVAVLDEPLADASILPQLYLSRFTRSQLTVALSGDGGDELLLGYQHIAAHAWVEKFSALPESIRRVAAAGFSRVPAGRGYFSPGFKAQRFARGLLAPDMWSRDVAWRGACDGPTLSRLLLPDVQREVSVTCAEQALAVRAAEAGPDASMWKAWTWAYLRTFLMDEVLVKVDRATMWFALEARAPLLDTAVVEYLLCLPASYKLGAWKGKRLFKELLRGRIPDAVLDRPKHGFAIPVADWLAGPLRSRLAEVTSDAFLQRQGLFQPAVIAQLMSEQALGRVDRRKELWALLMFQLWYRSWVESSL